MTVEDRVAVESVRHWRDWLAAHHADSPGVWVVTWKKASGRPRVDYDALVEEALCVGWVDSRPRSLDEDRSMLLMTPRRPGANWSRLNKDRIARLEAEGRLQTAGRAVVEAAKVAGTWTALDDIENLVEPADLRGALDADPAARTHWDGFPRTVRRSILEWLLGAKRETTRARRVAEVVTLAARGERANQWHR